MIIKLEESGSRPTAEIEIKPTTPGKNLLFLRLDTKATTLKLIEAQMVLTLLTAQIKEMS